MTIVYELGLSIATGKPVEEAYSHCGTMSIKVLIDPSLGEMTSGVSWKEATAVTNRAAEVLMAIVGISRVPVNGFLRGFSANVPHRAFARPVAGFNLRCPTAISVWGHRGSF